MKTNEKDFAGAQGVPVETRTRSSWTSERDHSCLGCQCRRASRTRLSETLYGARLRRMQKGRAPESWWRLGAAIPRSRRPDPAVLHSARDASTGV